MIIGLLDPALFFQRPESEVKEDIDSVLKACRQHGVKLLPLDDYWDDLWRKFGYQLEKSLSPSCKKPLQELRKLGEKDRFYSNTLPILLPNSGKVWKDGFDQLFNISSLGQEWVKRMANATIRAVNTQQEVIIFTRKIHGRNINPHAVGNCTLDEITRWVLHVQSKTINNGRKHVLCVHHPRNITEKWTSRFDWRLPSVSDGSRYPFCQPEYWWKKSTESYRTIESKPAWIDRNGNGWARPNISNGAGYHWDVFINAHQMQQKIGLNQVNIVAFGVPATEGKCGDIYHVPEKKSSKLNDIGWTC